MARVAAGPRGDLAVATEARIASLRRDGFTDAEIVEVIGNEATAAGPGQARIERDLVRLILPHIAAPGRGAPGRPGWTAELYRVRRATALRELAARGLAASPKNIAAAIRARGGEVGMTTRQLRALESRFGGR